MKFRDATNLLLSYEIDWKDVVGYEGLYLVSRCGLVVSLGNKVNHKLPILLNTNKDKDGYLYVVLRNNRKSKTVKIHRLVSETFIPKINEDLDVINHIDGNRTNNHTDNLEWCDQEYNWKVGSIGRSQQSVVKLSLAGGFIEKYKSLMEAGRQNNIQQGNITNCLKGRCKSVGGYRWVLEKDYKL